MFGLCRWLYVIYIFDCCSGRFIGQKGFITKRGCSLGCSHIWHNEGGQGSFFFINMKIWLFFCHFRVTEGRADVINKENSLRWFSGSTLSISSINSLISIFALIQILISIWRIIILSRHNGRWKTIQYMRQSTILFTKRIPRA